MLIQNCFYVNWKIEKNISTFEKDIIKPLIYYILMGNLFLCKFSFSWIFRELTEGESCLIKRKANKIRFIIYEYMQWYIAQRLHDLYFR